MHIKSIHLKGFKSYKDQLVDLTQGTNVFVGRNGSGKSNFFEAIRFVLGGDVDQLRSGENRQSLLHEGTSERNVNASVEVVVDNSDGRIPSPEGGEVKLLRMVGLKKDEYFLNARRSTKQEIATLLDMAGISSSNPSNIIAQGEVAALAGMSDERRLRMLQEVAGTQVYEQRRAESLRILTTTEEKREAIRSLMGDLDDKIGELARESAELAEFNAAERKRRAIEYVLFSAELMKATEALQELDANAGGAGNDAELRAGHDAAAATVAGLAKDVAARKSDLALATAEVAAAKKVLPKLQERRVKLGEKTSNARASVEADALGSEEAGRELARVEAEVAKKRAELAAGEPAFQAAQAALDSARVAASASEQRVNALSDKAGRSSTFKSRKERDTFLQALVGQHRGEHGLASKLAADHAKGAAAHGERGLKLAVEAAALEKAGTERGKEAALVAASLDDLAAARASATSAAHGAKARLDDADKAASELGGKAEAAAKAVFANMPQALRRGLEEIARLSDPSSPVYLPGIYGPLVDLVRPSHERYNLPVEAVAGPEIFNVIVADDGVAASIVAHLAKAKAGRVTLVPLNRIKPAEQQYPASEDCRSLTSFLQFDDKFAPAVKQQFGRVLLCKSSEVAAKYAREQGFICVTLEGDTANKRGALTGGFIDPSAARLKNVKVRQEAAGQLAELKAERAKIEAEVAAADVAVRGAAIKLGDSEDKARKLRDDAAALVLDAERKRREVAGERAKAEVAGREAVRVKEQVDLLAGRIADLEAEIASEMSSKLTPAEQAALESFSAQAEAARKAASQAAAAFESRRTARQDVTTQLEDNLLKRAAELRGRLSRTSSTGVSGDRRDELRQLENQFQAAVIAEKAALAAMESQQKRVAAQETELAKLNEDYSAASSALATVADSLRDAQLQDEKSLEKKRAVLKRKDDASNKLRDLGTLADKELDKYSPMKRKALVEELGKVHEQLRALSHVNKRSSTEFESFENQKAGLSERYQDIENGDKTIHALVESLDEKKDELTITTFKGVQKHFKEIFAELVPRGSASLVLRTSDDGEGDENAPAKKGKGKARAERFSGVGITASFSDTAQTSTLSSMSGGQRTLVSLTLLFAIQRADPAPFYILDEVDAALDPTHRTAVGRMLQKQASGASSAQFIISSFGEELLEFGDKWYGVSVSNKVSSVEEQSNQEAVAFVHAARNMDGGPPGDNTAVAKSITKKARV